MEKYTVEWFKKNMTKFEELYFENDKVIDGIPIRNRTVADAENEIDKYEKTGEIDLFVAAWKMGRLKKSNSDVKREDGIKFIYNGYGKPINRKDLEVFLKNISKNKVNDYIDKREYEEAYYALLGNCRGTVNIDRTYVPQNFGSVYLITLMHFISKGTIPIYDRYAHIAVKALYTGKNPNQIYVGSAPDKKDVKNVINLLQEYMWLLERVFDKSNIDRVTDRALWVYGHAGANYQGSTDIKEKKDTPHKKEG